MKRMSASMKGRTSTSPVSMLVRCTMPLTYARAATPLKLAIDAGSASIESTKIGAQTEKGARIGDPAMGIGSAPAAKSVCGCTACPAAAAATSAPVPRMKLLRDMAALTPRVAGGEDTELLAERRA